MPIDIDLLIAQQLKLVPESLSDDIAYGDTTNWDSLTHIDLMLAIESAYGVEIDADQMLELTTIGAIRQFVARLHAGR